MRKLALICLLAAGCFYDYGRLQSGDAGTDAMASGIAGVGGGTGGRGGSAATGGAGGATGGSAGAIATAGTGGATGATGGTTGIAGTGGAGNAGVGGSAGRGGGSAGTSGSAGATGGSAAPGRGGAGGASAGATGSGGVAGTSGGAGTGGSTSTGGAGGAVTGGSSGQAGATGLAGAGGSAAVVTVRLKGDPSATQWIWMTLQIINGGSTALPLSDLTVRYWYTYDTTPVVAQTDQCSYAFSPPGQCSNIVRTWATVTPAKSMADSYYQVGFAAAAGNLNPSATAEFGLAFHKNNFANFIQTNDYSYNAATAFTTTTKVTLYRAGVLVYGTEPQ